MVNLISVNNVIIVIAMLRGQGEGGGVFAQPSRERMQLKRPRNLLRKRVH